MFHVGQKVEAIRSDWEFRPDEYRIKSGEKFVVREVVDCGPYYGIGLRFVGLVNPGEDRPYSIGQDDNPAFRPITETDISIFEKFKNPTPVKELEEV